MELDLSVFNLIHSFAGRYFVLDWIFIFLARYLPYIVVLLVIISVVRLKDSRERLLHGIIFILAGIFARGILAEIIRFFFPRERPFLAMDFEPLISGLSSNSLPSGHASFFFAIAITALLLKNHRGIQLLIFAILISLGRIYVGVHYPLDIVVGAIIGAVSGFIAYKILDKSINRLDAENQINKEAVN